MERLLTIRLGAVGDTLITSPLYRLLKEDGYHVTVYMKQRMAACLKNCPHIDEYHWHDESIPLKDCPDKFEEIGKVLKFDYPRAVISVPREASAVAAAEILQNFPIADLTIEEEPIESVIRRVFKGEVVKNKNNA